METNASPQATTAPKPTGKPLEEIDDVEWLRWAVEKLWHLIDDIDTADDMFKENFKGFNAYTMRRQAERHKVLESDGYDLFMPE